MATVNVNDASGLEQAILNAQHGHVINLPANVTWTVGPHMSSGNAFPVIDKEITIVGNNTVIERDDTQGEFRFFEVALGGSLTVRGITFDQGKDDGSDTASAIWNKGGPLVIYDCEFINNGDEFNVEAVYSETSAAVEVRDSRFVNNSGGLTIDGLSAVIDRCQFIDNYNRLPVLFSAWPGSSGITLSGCLFYNNSGSAFGSHCIHVDTDGSIEITNCNFIDNSKLESHTEAEIGHFTAGQSLRIKDCLVAGTGTTPIPYTLWLYISDTDNYIEIDGCRFLNNYGGIGLTTKAYIKNCRFEGNESSEGKATILDWFGGSIIRYCHFEDNFPQDVYSYPAGDMCDAILNSWDQCSGPLPGKVTNTRYIPVCSVCDPCDQKGIEACCAEPAG